MVNRTSRVPDISTSILVFSSNINWGTIGFLLIKIDDDTRICWNISLFVSSYYSFVFLIRAPQIRHMLLVVYLVLVRILLERKIKLLKYSSLIYSIFWLTISN